MSTPAPPSVTAAPAVVDEAESTTADAGGPRRIQRKRAAGWKMPENTVFVGRGTHLGNPFRIYQHCKGLNGDWGVEDAGRFNQSIIHGFTREGAAKCAVEMYRKAFDEAHPEGSTLRWGVLSDLAGKDLACWCREGDPCHGDVLLDLANEWLLDNPGALEALQEALQDARQKVTDGTAK